MGPEPMTQNRFRMHDTTSAGPAAARNSFKRWLIAAAAVLFLAAGAAFLLVDFDALRQFPNVPRPPLPAADPALEQQAAEIRQKLESAPADAALWQGLARTYVLQGKFAEAVPAYKSAIDNGAEGAAVQSAYGEAQVMAASGQVTKEALAAFQAALAKDEGESRARYYLALADAQGGRLHEALDQWIKLESDSRGDAPWRKSLSERIDQTANALGLDPQNLPGRGGAAAGEPSMADLTLAARLPQAERTAFLGGKTKSLAARLGREPGDVKGWTVLAQAYKLLGDYPQSLAAWKQAAALAPDNEGVLIHYAEAILALRQDGQKLPPEFAALTQRIRTLDPKNLEGLYFGGLAEQDAGNVSGARTLWEELLRELPPESPQRVEIQRQLDALAGGG